jgi:hypothetical protein
MGRLSLTSALIISAVTLVSIPAFAGAKNHYAAPRDGSVEAACRSQARAQAAGLRSNWGMVRRAAYRDCLSGH